MIFRRDNGRVSFRCNLTGCETTIDTDQTDIWLAADVPEKAGWICMKRGKYWTHFCCAAHSEAHYGAIL